ALTGSYPEIIRIDHHRPGDPGYGRSPEEFLPASSIGQVWASLLRLRNDGWDSPLYSGTGSVYWNDRRWYGDTPYGQVDVPEALLLVAAADHCLAAAYRGECPGVDPDKLMQWRVETRAEFQNSQ